MIFLVYRASLPLDVNGFAVTKGERIYGKVIPKGERIYGKMTHKGERIYGNTHSLK